MEIYRGQNTFQVMDASNNSDILSKYKDEIAEVRGLTVEAIKNGEPFLYHGTYQNGDNLIIRWSHTHILSRLCKEEGLDPTALQIGTSRLWDEEPTPQPLKRIMDLLPQAQTSRHFYYLWLCNLGLPLGLNITPDDTLNIPQPLKSYSGPMSEYSKEQTIEEGMEIREKYRDFSPLVVITQGGSKSEKRFSDEQVEFFKNSIETIYPEGFVMVASDKDIKSVSDITPTLYAADKAIVTDSFLGHLAAGLRVMRNDRIGKLEEGDWMGLYTMGWPDVWGVPGGHIIASPAAKIHQSRGLSTIWSVMDPEDYHKILQNKQTTGIEKIDMRLLIDNMFMLLPYCLTRYY